MEQNKFDPFQFIGFLLISAILMFWFYDNQSSIIENQQVDEVENIIEDTPEILTQKENVRFNNTVIAPIFKEKRLEKRFGDKFTNYKSQVPYMIPSLSLKKQNSYQNGKRQSLRN